MHIFEEGSMGPAIRIEGSNLPSVGLNERHVRSLKYGRAYIRQLDHTRNNNQEPAAVGLDRADLPCPGGNMAADQPGGTVNFGHLQRGTRRNAGGAIGEGQDNDPNLG